MHLFIKAFVLAHMLTPGLDRELSFQQIGGPEGLHYGAQSFSVSVVVKWTVSYLTQAAFVAIRQGHSIIMIGDLERPLRPVAHHPFRVG